MRWAILAPDRSARWDGQALAFGDGALASDAPPDDAHEDLWRTYHAHIFNPARLNPRMMHQEMPVQYWKHLPEAQLPPALVREAGTPVHELAARQPQAPRPRRPPARQAGESRPRAPRRGAAAAGHARPALAARRRTRLPRLSAVGTGDADGVRRRPGGRARAAAGRTAGRYRGPHRPPVLRPGRPAARSRTG